MADNTEQIISHKYSEIEAQYSVEMKQSLIEENSEDFRLKEWSKGQKLSHDQLKFLKSTISQSSLTTTQISNEYRVSVSQINKIKRMNEQIILDGPKKKFIKLSKMNKKMLTNEILKSIESNNNTFYVTEITDFVNRKLNWNYLVQFVRNFMKNELIFSYKRVKSRPKFVDFDRLNWLRILFSIKFSQLMSQSTLLINIDETSIGRNAKINYSWGLRGYPIEAKNISITGSV